MTKQYSKQMTKLGHEQLIAEYNELLYVDRAKTSRGVMIAAAEGDRSENAEYIYGKKRMREIDKRLKYLASLMKGAVIVDPSSIESDKVEFGATVSIVDEEDRQKKWMIVGEGEADSKKGSISYVAPLAKALLGKKVGDNVLVHRPIGDLEYEILKIEYL